MPQHTDWRSHSAYDYIDTLTPAELAWEFLRRNSAYVEGYEALRAAGALKKSEGRAFAGKWGLSFRRGSRKNGSRRSRRLGAQHRPVSAAPHGKPGNRRRPRRDGAGHHPPHDH